MRTLSSLLCQPAPNTAETTELGAMRTQSSIPQFLHTNETSENLSNALHTLLIHCLRLSAGPSATLGVRVCAVRRRPEVARSAALTSAGSHNSATSAPHPVGFPTGYPAFRHFFYPRASPGAEREGLAVAATPSSRLSSWPASAWEPWPT